MLNKMCAFGCSMLLAISILVCSQEQSKSVLQRIKELEEQNQKLVQENLELKKQILELQTQRLEQIENRILSERLGLLEKKIEKLTVTAEGRLGIGTMEPGEKLEVEGNIKTKALIATRYPRLVGMLETDVSVTIPNASGAIVVPYTTASNQMEIPLTTGGPDEVYLITYSYYVRVVADYRYSGIRVMQGNNVVREYWSEGSYPNSQQNQWASSASLFITGLPPGNHTVQLRDHALAGDRTFSASPRQLMVYQIR